MVAMASALATGHYRSGFIPTLAEGEIPEFLPGDPFLPVQPEQEVELPEDSGFIQVLLIDPVQPCSLVIAAKMEVVAPRRCPDETDFGHIRTAATIGAAGHPDDNVLFPQAVPGQQRLDLP